MRFSDNAYFADSYVSTIGVGQMALQIFTVRSVEDFRRFGVASRRWDNASICIWPPRSNVAVKWPPPFALTNNGLSLFIDRWKPVS